MRVARGRGDWKERGRGVGREAVRERETGRKTGRIQWEGGRMEELEMEGNCTNQLEGHSTSNAVQHKAQVPQPLHYIMCSAAPHIVVNQEVICYLLTQSLVVNDGCRDEEPCEEGGQEGGREGCRGSQKWRQGGGGLGKGREGLDFGLDWVVVNGTVGFPLKEVYIDRERGNVREWEKEEIKRDKGRGKYKARREREREGERNEDR